LSAPLTNAQKRYLSQLSDRAYARQHGGPTAIASSPGGEDTGEGGPQTGKAVSPTAARAAFRHAEVARAVHKAGLRCCSQDDYGAVKAHFLHLLGEDGAALRAHVRGQNNEARVAEWKLFDEIKAAGDTGITVRYVEQICRQQFGCTITEASTKQKWSLLYTVRNRAAKKRGMRNAERGTNPENIIPLHAA